MLQKTQNFVSMAGPHQQDRDIPKSKLSGGVNIHKIKLRKSGYRLVYQVSDQVVTVTVIAIGKREGNKVYDVALERL